MERKYKNIENPTVATDFFYGFEVEHSPAQYRETLFVVGVQSVKDILREVDQLSKNFTLVEHVYFGANQSFHPSNENDWLDWTNMVTKILKQGYWVTLDFDIKYAERVYHEFSLETFNKFIPMISVKLPHARQYNYNTTIKIDDKGFEASNPGVWCHRLGDLLDTEKFTNWEEYKNDRTV